MGGSALVAAGILLSRISGLLREAVFSYFFGISLYAEAFKAALRMPNLLQNLLGEGTLSASFIPVYAELIEQGRQEEAGRVAGAILALLIAVAGGVAVLGVALAPVIVTVLLPGFSGETREITIALVRILFPMTGVLVLAAWALGILNSHRSFFLPYVSSVLWNTAMVGAMVLFGLGLSFDLHSLVLATGWGALFGGLLQFGVQLPRVLRLEPALRVRWDPRRKGVREALRNAGPAVLGRGVVQFSGYFDLVLGSALAGSAVALLGYAQTLYALPVGLFGMSVAAAELPELSRQREAAPDVLRARTNAAIERVAFYVVPSLVAFLAIGDAIVAALYQRGAFDPQATRLVHSVLAGYALGLLPSTTTRVLSSASFALRDTGSPARFATARVVISGVLGFALMTQLEPVRFDTFGVAMPGGILSGVRVAGEQIGAVGLSAAAGIAAWVEWALLRRSLARRIGPIGARWNVLLRAFGAGIAGAGAAWLVRWFMPPVHPVVDGVLQCAVFGLVYLGLGWLLNLDEAGTAIRRLRG